MALSGTFVLDKSENLQDFLGKLGLPEDKITAYSAVKPTIDVTLNGEALTMKSSHDGKTTENVLYVGKSCTYKLSSGAEFQVEMQGPSGNTAKGTFTAKGKTGGINVEFGGGQLIETFTLEGVTCKRFYKKQ